MYDIPFEDEYWERRRIEFEERWKSEEPDIIMESLFLDDELDKIEAEYGCPMEELGEGDLMEILDRHLQEKVELLTAKWDSNLGGIFYTYEAAA